MLKARFKICFEASLAIAIPVVFQCSCWAGSLSDYQMKVGSRLAAGSHPRKALPYLNRAVKLSPNNPEVYVERGNLFLILEKLEFSLTDLNKAVLLNTNNPKAYFLRYRVFFEMGKIDHALKDLNMYIKLAKSKMHKCDGYRNRAKLYLEQKKYDLAINDLAKAISLHNNASNYWLRGNTYMKQKKYSLAVADYTKAIELSDKKEANDIDRIYSLRANAYEKLGKVELAKKDRKFVDDRVKNGWGAFLR